MKLKNKNKRAWSPSLILASMHDKLYACVHDNTNKKSSIDDKYYNQTHKYKITQIPNIPTAIDILTQGPTCSVSKIILILHVVTLLVMQVE